MRFKPFQSKRSASTGNLLDRQRDKTLRNWSIFSFVRSRNTFILITLLGIIRLHNNSAQTYRLQAHFCLKIRALFRLIRRWTRLLQLEALGQHIDPRQRHTTWSNGPAQASAIFQKLPPQAQGFAHCQLKKQLGDLNERARPAALNSTHF